MSNILIIEDDKGARLALSRAIEKWGYKVLQAGNGQEGLKKLKSKDVDLVLCDIQLPGINGIEVLERIQKEHPNVLVVIMTLWQPNMTLLVDLSNKSLSEPPQQKKPWSSMRSLRLPTA